MIVGIYNPGKKAKRTMKIPLKYMIGAKGKLNIYTTHYSIKTKAISYSQIRFNLPTRLRIPRDSNLLFIFRRYHRSLLLHILCTRHRRSTKHSWRKGP